MESNMRRRLPYRSAGQPLGKVSRENGHKTTVIVIIKACHIVLLLLFSGVSHRP